MKLSRVLALTLAVSACWAHAADTAPKMSTDAQKAAYAIGQNFGKTLVREAPDLDPALVQQGVADALAKRTPALTEAEQTQAIGAFQQAMMAKKASQAEATAATNAQAAKKFLTDNGKKPGVTTLPSGLQYQVVSSGKGPSPKKTDTVKVHYHGTLIDGKVFDSSVQRGEPATFRVDQVIPGWTEALQKMKVGDKWKLFIPPELAYGNRGAGGVIEPGSALIFDVELLAIQK
jgi:FKBP-type peptidyl-prolyl cis-trans isomerase